MKLDKELVVQPLLRGEGSLVLGVLPVQELEGAPKELVVAQKPGEPVHKLLQASGEPAHRAHVLHHAAQAYGPAPGLGRHSEIYRCAEKIGESCLDRAYPAKGGGTLLFHDPPGGVILVHLLLHDSGLVVESHVLALLMVVGQGPVVVHKQAVHKGHIVRQGVPDLCALVRSQLEHNEGEEE